MENYKNIVDEIWEEETEELITYDYIMNNQYFFYLIIEDDNIHVWSYVDEDENLHYFLTDDYDESCCEVEKIASITWDMNAVEPTDEQLIDMFPCDYSGEHMYINQNNTVTYSWFRLV